MNMYEIPNPNSGIVIPETWENVDRFADWYIAAGLPFLPPINSEVFVVEDTTSYTIFRKGQFQVELYLIYPQPIVIEHEHPDVETVTIMLGKYNKNGILDTFYRSDIQKNGDKHGTDFRVQKGRGFPLIVIEHWLKSPPTTVASRWKGFIVGKKHHELIKRFNPECIIENQYADVTKNEAS